MFDFWTRGFRRRRIARRPTPGAWPGFLEEGIWFWKALSGAQRARLQSLTAIFLHEKEIFIPEGIPEPERARVMVAAAACVLLQGFSDWYCFDRIQTVILTLDLFRQQIDHPHVGGLQSEVVASGVYRRGAPVTLCWPEVERDCADNRRSHNVVIHEFAHHIDDLDGSLDGNPPFSSSHLTEDWRQIVTLEMRRLEEQTAQGQRTVLDPYGLSSSTEFFAVACEAYVCNPHALSAAHARLFRLLQELFRFDPREWTPE
ncbi:MAG: hypothetical protein EHM42_15580 [Planctomycetaceae bacterium]|nr:MAG: hypothetical protein EHM42_15580 [Planctomycetaceae bacterium]